MNNQLKTVVLLSGGLDSSVLLAQVVREYGSKNVTALNIYYGQKHKKEQECAEFQAKYHNVDLININLKDVYSFDKSCPLLEGSTEKMPHKSYAEQLADMGGEGTVSTYVPFRNGLFISYAAAIALQLGASTIYYGAHSDDAAGSAYPDCTASFIYSMREAVYQGSGKKVCLEAPFWSKTKADIVAAGIKLGVPMHKTWSCYEGKDKPCGSCGTCIDRAAAFEKNGIPDPSI